jgi:hypothetical protein
MATATAFTMNYDKPRFSDEMVVEKKPCKSPPPKRVEWHACPLCEQPLPHPRTSIPSVFWGGIRRLVVALWMIVTAALRCVRFGLAGALCLVGLIGTCSRSLGLRIAHPDDRRFLTKDA